VRLGEERVGEIRRRHVFGSQKIQNARSFQHINESLTNGRRILPRVFFKPWKLAFERDALMHFLAPLMRYSGSPLKARSCFSEGRKKRPDLCGVFGQNAR
jgi:hypothetical protein